MNCDEDEEALPDDRESVWQEGRKFRAGTRKSDERLAARRNEEQLAQAARTKSPSIAKRPVHHALGVTGGGGTSGVKKTEEGENRRRRWMEKKNSTQGN